MGKLKLIISKFLIKADNIINKKTAIMFPWISRLLIIVDSFITNKTARMLSWIRLFVHLSIIIYLIHLKFSICNSTALVLSVGITSFIEGYFYGRIRK